MKADVRNGGGTVQDFLAQLVKGKKVLDVGCVQHSAEQELEGTWLHRHIVRNATYVLGLDILKTDVEELARRGYNVVCGDATTATLNDSFDVITAGEIIEHIGNPQLFLANMARHLNDDGRLVLTTPYPFFVLHFVESVIFDPDERWNREHVAWFCPFTLRNLIERCGLTVESYRYFTRSRKLRRVMQMFNLPCYSAVASTIVVVARKAVAE